MCLSVSFLCDDFDGEPYIASTDEIDQLLWLTSEEVKVHPKAPPWTIQSVEFADEFA